MSPQFKYCVEQSRNPEIEGELKSLRLNLSRPRIGQRTLKGLKINCEKYSSESRALERLDREFSGEGPDILRISRSQVFVIVEDRLRRGLQKRWNLHKATTRIFGLVSSGIRCTVFGGVFGLLGGLLEIALGSAAATIFEQLPNAFISAFSVATLAQAYNPRRIGNIPSSIIFKSIKQFPEV
ncbi:hypothetical protein HRED_07564, partial [Candidatus Haloredivivus sp. G17]